MTSRKDTLWEHGIRCVTTLALGIVNAPFIPLSMKRILTPLFLLALILDVLFDRWKRARYSEEELEREKQDERNQMIHTQAVWYCHVAEDWVLLVLFVVFGFCVADDAIASALVFVLAARCLLSFGIRWWLNRKY